MLVTLFHGMTGAVQLDLYTVTRLKFEKLVCQQTAKISFSAGAVRRRHVPLSISPSATRLAQLILSPVSPSYTKRPEHRPNSTTMKRKIWVKRPGSSPTQVTVGEDELIDDVRDVILRKYTNSLGRCFDSPDVILKIITRGNGNDNYSEERMLGPEEQVGSILDTYYPGGQTIDEALLIDVPKKRTPRPSPMGGHHMPYYIAEELRPGEGAGEYFPPMPVMPSPRMNPHLPHIANPHHPLGHSMAVLTTGQVPTLPSPGGRTHRHHRPKYGRQHTSSPTILHTIPSSGSLPGASSSRSILCIHDG